jgi:hypothetical protein
MAAVRKLHSDFSFMTESNGTMKLGMWNFTGQMKVKAVPITGREGP